MYRESQSINNKCCLQSSLCSQEMGFSVTFVSESVAMVHAPPSTTRGSPCTTRGKFIYCSIYFLFFSFGIMREHYDPMSKSSRPEKRELPGTSLTPTIHIYHLLHGKEIQMRTEFVMISFS